MEIRPLTPSLVNDYLAFFDRDAFADNPAWADCYCGFMQFPGTHAEWECAKAADNRLLVAGRIERGEAQGLLAYDGGKVVGWVQAGFPAELPSLTPFIGATPGLGVGAITCFVIAATHRRQGLARRLLEAAVESLRARGATSVEAYPKKTAECAADLFPGPLALYLEAGFVQVGELERRFVMSKPLG